MFIASPQTVLSMGKQPMIARHSDKPAGNIAPYMRSLKLIGNRLPMVIRNRNVQAAEAIVFALSSLDVDELLKLLPSLAARAPTTILGRLLDNRHCFAPVEGGLGLGLTNRHRNIKRVQFL